MVPPLRGVTLPHLALGWVFLGLVVTIIITLILGIRKFNRRVIS